MSQSLNDDLNRFDHTVDPEMDNSAYTLGPLQAGPPCCHPRPLIRVEHLSVRYGEKPALEEITLDIHRGCITALIGPSGCGKTTFLSVLNRLTDMIPGCRVAGRVRMDSTDLLHPALDVQALRREVGMIFQKPVPFPLSIRRNIELSLLEHRITKRSELDGIVEQVLTDVGLWNEVKDRLNAPAPALSGGQQQRLCIARALALEPGILLMDEPCSALDPIASGVVEDLIQRLRGRYTVIIVTHNLAQARRIANYAGFFWVKERAGTLIEFGQCRQIFESPNQDLTAAYVSGKRG
jgi:phosphate transport system ATP-binding protein